MTTQNFYTPEKAASVIGCSVAEVLENIKSGRLRGHFMDNVGNYVVTHDDLLAFLKSTHKFEAVSKLIPRRLILVDRDARVQDIMKMELGREGVEIKVATNDREVAFLADDIQPDVVCVHLAATTREKDEVRAGLERARKVAKCYIILYHNHVLKDQRSDAVQHQIRMVDADEVVVMDRGVTPLVDAVRRRFGLKTSRPTLRRPLDP